MRSMPIRSGTWPVAMPWAILPTISVCGMYVRLILQSGFLVFHASTSMSTICLLPPERSHIVRSPLLAHVVVAAGTLLAGGGVSSWLQAAAASISAATTAMAGHLGRVLIATLLCVEWTRGT